MKKEFGDWIRRFFLCLSSSEDAEGLRRSITNYNIIKRVEVILFVMNVRMDGRGWGWKDGRTGMTRF